MNSSIRRLIEKRELIMWFTLMSLIIVFVGILVRYVLSIFSGKALPFNAVTAVSTKSFLTWIFFSHQRCVFPPAGIHPDLNLTGRENIYPNGTILGMSSKENKSKFDYIAEFSGLEEFIDTSVKRYS